jgi:hypothetical protein
MSDLWTAALLDRPLLSLWQGIWQLLCCAAAKHLAL